jgi:hypothetical protein
VLLTNLVFTSGHIDDNDKLYLWDLTSLGQIRLEVTTRVERPVTLVTDLVTRHLLKIHVKPSLALAVSYPCALFDDYLHVPTSNRTRLLSALNLAKSRRTISYVGDSLNTLYPTLGTYTLRVFRMMAW